MNYPNHNTRLAWHPVLRPVSGVLIAAQLALAIQPLSALAQDEAGRAAANPLVQAQINRLNLLHRDREIARARIARDQQSPADKASDAQAEIEDLVLSLQRNVTAAVQAPAAFQSRASGPNAGAQVAGDKGNRASRLSDAQVQQHQSRLRDLIAQRSAFREAQEQRFAQDRAELAARERLSAQAKAILLQRHDEAQAQYRERDQRYQGLAATYVNYPTAQNLDDLARFVQEHRSAKRYEPSIDPGKSGPQTPWRSPQPIKRPPAETKTAWHWQLHQDYYEKQSVKLAQLGTTNIGGIAFTVPPEPSRAPQAADLAETEDITLTPAIRAKAQELDYNPVKIHNWLASTMVWQPTWGSIQGAEGTLRSQRGNAIDIASLHLALLRASSIPARYQFGTIEIPAEELNNWIGGAQKVEAALQLLAQGGIAARGLVEAGRIAKVRMEHVWVNAYVHWVPGRGSQPGGVIGPAPGNPGGTLTTALGHIQHPSPNAHRNAWVPMDASYKQYRYAPGMNLLASVPVDATALLASASEGATINQSQGYVQNLNQANLQAQLDAYQNRLRNFINSSPTGASSTVGDVIGAQNRQSVTHTVLAGTTPMPVVSQGAQIASLPASLQHQFRYQLSDDFGNVVLNFQSKLTRLNGKRLSLAYIPATQADADLIASYLPGPNADGSPIRPDQLPTSLPGYLIRLKAQISVDGQAQATSAVALAMGTELASSGGFTQLGDPTQWDLSRESSNVVGQATSIGISAGGISAFQLEQLKARLQDTQAKLQAASTTPSNATALLGNLTGEQISGDLLTATLWSWFAAAESHNRLSQNQANMLEIPGLSYGLFHAVAQPIYSWGVIRQVKFPGVNLDIGHIRNLSAAKDNDNSKWTAYNRLRGQYMSALEHAIPERFFNDPSKCNPEGSATPVAGLPACPQGISAVKAIGLAAAQGQKIYTITRQVYSDNPGIVSSSLYSLSQSTKQGIQNALDAGYEVTAHESPITQSGWSGAGYIFIDPDTGAGGYIIDGGSNGAWLSIFSGALSGLVDSLVKKLRNPDAVNGPLNELSRSQFINQMAKFATIVSFIKSIFDIADDANLSGGKKVAQIIFALAFTIAAMEGAALFGVFFASPFTAAIFGIFLAVTLAFLLLELNAAIAGL